MSLFGYYLEKHGAFLAPWGETHKFKYEIKYKKIGCEVKISIWNKCIDVNEPILCVVIDKNFNEKYTRINAYYPFSANSQEIFKHYRTIENLLKKLRK